MGVPTIQDYLDMMVSFQEKQDYKYNYINGGKHVEIVSDKSYTVMPVEKFNEMMKKGLNDLIKDGK